ncbi:MAG: ATP-dependent helicase HrpB [Pseudomonadota bacterium]
MPAPDTLPVDEVLPKLQAELSKAVNAVLVAPPGAGKTTRVPLALLNAPWRDGGRIIVLEPRRLAARAAAQRMAQTLGERVGQTVGLRVRFESRVSDQTRIEVVTEGVFTAMVVEDPALEGVAAVIFDEFHERSLDADFGLALGFEAQDALRSDLRLLVMSATLDGSRVARLLGDGTPVVESLGRAHPVELRHRPVSANETTVDAMVAVIEATLRTETGSILAFLPGMSEIRQVENRLRDRLATVPDVTVAPLYGALSPAEQDLAISPVQAGQRKVVLATPIAESSLTIEGVRVVIDSGLVRQTVFEPALGVTRLVTRRASRASAEQRMGRAGRTEPGVCIRLWSEASTTSLPAFAPPEIETTDLAPLVLRAALFGEAQPERLKWLDPLPAAHLKQARSDLLALGAVDDGGTITDRGKALARLPLPLREAAMVVAAAQFGPQALQDASLLAVLLSERGLGGTGPDLALRLDAFSLRKGRREASAKGLARRIGELSRPFLTSGKAPIKLTVGALLSLGFPDRIAQRRGESAGQVRFRMANGRAVTLDATDPLSREAYIVAADFQGRAEAARLLAGAAISQDDIRRLHQDQLRSKQSVSLSAPNGKVEGSTQEALGSVVLSERPLSAAELVEASSQLLLSQLQTFGIDVLPWSARSLALIHRLRFAARLDNRYAPAADLLKGSLDFLAEAFVGCRAYHEVDPKKLHDLMEAEAINLLGWEAWSQLDAMAPMAFDPPAGQSAPIDYSGSEPTVALKPQQIFGVTTHPMVGNTVRPLTFSLLSPAGRPIQTTSDLPGLWAGTWQDIRRDMRGRYPKHFWPEDPANAQPTSSVKPRK